MVAARSPARTSKPKFRIEAANQLIADVPPLRNTVELAKLAMARLGKDVIDLLDVSVSFDGREVLRDIEWRIAPGERTGIVGANGAGKSTLLGLIAAPFNRARDASSAARPSNWPFSTSRATGSTRSPTTGSPTCWRGCAAAMRSKDAR